MSEDNMKHSEEAFELLPEYDFSKGVRGRFYSPKKVSTSIRLDNDILLYFKKKASEEKIGYQTLINMALRDYIKSATKNESFPSN
uniref:BrnA antitoxin of type II toxin-antitoxin system n=1 Tax=Gracilinema caldarium TaxID=215591 RepID=A0A7C3E1X8_9SPIR